MKNTHSKKIHMKTSLLVTIILLFSNSLYAQSEFAPIGAVWTQNAIAYDQGGPTFHPLKDFFTIECIGDTVINNLSYRKVGEYLIYQEQDKIYNFWEDSLRLIYDFDVSVGDTVLFELIGCNYSPDQASPFHFEVTEVDQIIIDQISLKRVKCSSLIPSAFPDYEYIEKIGSINRVVENTFGCSTFPETKLDWLRCYSDNEISYQSEEFLSHSESDCEFQSLLNATTNPFNQLSFSMYPNPTENTLYFSITEKTIGLVTVQIFNTIGHKLFEEEISLNDNNEISLNHFEKGTYILKVLDEKARVGIKKIVKL